jgi:transposase InsO family protein
VQVLHQHGILLSMSRAGNPYDNATSESWIKTLKVEEIYGNEYQDLTVSLKGCTPGDFCYRLLRL